MMRWRNTIIDWRRPESWCCPLTSWIQPYFTKNGFKGLQEKEYQEMYSDDSDWFDVLEEFTIRDADELIGILSNAFVSAYIKAYHGCRVDDAGIYHQHGILGNNPDGLANQARDLIFENPELAALRPRFEQKLLGFQHRNHYKGLVYLALDDRLLVEMAGQYLLYGSEWILDLLGPEAYEVLRKRGIPTLLHVQLPIEKVQEADRVDLARALLQEWIRITVNSPEDIPIKNFAFCLHEDIPAEMIVKHSHPEYVFDPYRNGMKCASELMICPTCSEFDSHKG